MFFDKEMITVNILDVIELNQKNINVSNKGRNFNALSFRIHANAHLKTKKDACYLEDNYVSYIPSRLDYSRKAETDELIVIHFDTTNYHTENIEVFLPENPQKISELFFEILDCWNKKEIGYKYKCTALLYGIFAECYCQNYKREFKPSKIQNSIDYISQNYKNKDISLKEIANQSFISEIYFRKLFKEQYGISPKKYIINLRIQNALGLISAGYHSLKEISDMCGYNDYKHFSTEFKKIVGVSPSEYRYEYP